MDGEGRRLIAGLARRLERFAEILHAYEFLVQTLLVKGSRLVLQGLTADHRSLMEA